MTEINNKPQTSYQFIEQLWDQIDPTLKPRAVIDWLHAQAQAAGKPWTWQGMSSGYYLTRKRMTRSRAAKQAWAAKKKRPTAPSVNGPQLELALRDAIEALARVETEYHAFKQRILEITR